MTDSNANESRSPERCHVCDAVLATEADNAAFLVSPSTSDDLLALCWSAVCGTGCIRTPVDWRARALTSEKLRAELLDALQQEAKRRGEAERLASESRGAAARSFVEYLRSMSAKLPNREALDTWLTLWAEGDRR